MRASERAILKQFRDNISLGWYGRNGRQGVKESATQPYRSSQANRAHSSQNDIMMKEATLVYTF